jgi:hypothetical protein
VITALAELSAVLVTRLRGLVEDVTARHINDVVEEFAVAAKLDGQELFRFRAEDVANGVTRAEIGRIGCPRRPGCEESIR